MKNLIKLIMILAIPALFWSCKKDENKDYFLGGTSPVLSSSVTGTIPLSFANKDKAGVTFNWTNPAYQFTTGISSRDVVYLLEIDTVGANFTNPARLQLQFANELSVKFSQDEFNNLLVNKMGLTMSTPHNIEARVTSNLGKDIAVLSSNVMKYTVTPFDIPPPPPVVPIPTTGQLFIIGSATSWSWNQPVPVPKQQFTKINDTHYELTIDLIAGGAYLLIPVNGQYAKYCVADKTAPGISYGGDFFKEGKDDIPAPPVSGSYKISVDFQKGKFTVVKQP